VAACKVAPPFAGQCLPAPNGGLDIDRVDLENYDWIDDREGRRTAFSRFVTSMTAPIASGWSESPGGPSTGR
jgi:hypothetical protein